MGADRRPEKARAVKFNVRMSTARRRTEVVLRRKIGGVFEEIARKDLDNECQTQFQKPANYDKATLKARWPEQDGDHRPGKSAEHTVITH